MSSNLVLLYLVTLAAFGMADVCLIQEKFHISPDTSSLAANQAADAKKLRMQDLQFSQQGHRMAQEGERHHSLGLQLLNAGVVWAASWKIGAQFPSLFMLPMIVGYILCGIVCGPYVTGMLFPEVIDTNKTFSISNIVSNGSLAFIGFCAGSELHFPTLGWDKFKIICRIIAAMGFFIVVCGTPIVYFMVEPLMPIFSTEEAPCKLAAAITICVVEMAGSVIEVLAVYWETKAEGPMTELLLGVTMLSDMTVLVMFAIATNISIKACPLEQAQISMTAATLSVFFSIILWVVGGLLLAAVLQCYLMLPEFGLGLKPALILGTAYTLYQSLMLLNDKIPDWSLNWGTINVEPLIICMISATIVNNFSDRRERFAEALHALTPWIMPAFFTVVGATLDLNVIADNIVVVPLLFCLRFVALATGARLSTQQMSLDANVSQHLWMTIQSQSGVTLGLLVKLGQGQIGKQPWSETVTAVITGGVCINQLIGPALCRYGIRSVGESHEEGEDGKDGKVEDTTRGVTLWSKVRALVFKNDEDEESDLMRTARLVSRSTSFLLPGPN